MVEDLGGAKDIEYIRKGMSELSVNLFFISTVINLTDFNRRGIGHSDKPRNLHTPWGEIFLGEKSYVNFHPLFFSPFDNNNSHQTAEIRSKHGLILDCSLQLTNERITDTTFELLNQWARSFYQDKRYGFLHETGQDSDLPGGIDLLRCERNQPILDVKAWLEDETKCNFDGFS